MSVFVVVDAVAAEGGEGGVVAADFDNGSR